mmetsp:Transcript_75413/g.244134  ORF Transcript_75413/g.244134 Transcript_75413/m.244134 type:complete len:141 (-) Transcript_75413:160-582(-)
MSLLPATAQRGCRQRPVKFENIAVAWDADDRARGRLPEAPLLLYGSSILRLWQDAAEHWHPLPTINRAFGGSRTWEAVLHLDRVLQYRPRVIIFYCGSNDVNYHAQVRSWEEDAAEADAQQVAETHSQDAVAEIPATSPW